MSGEKIDQHPAAGGGKDIQIELVGPDGQHIYQHLVTVEDLLQQKDLSLPIGHGVTLCLEEASQANLGAAGVEAVEGYYEEESHTSISEETEGDEVMRRDHIYGPPPGTRVAEEWYDILNTLREENATSRLRQAHGKSAATPLKLFPTSSKDRFCDIQPLPNQTTLLTHEASRREVLASFSPPADPGRDYCRLQYVSIFSEASDYHRFRPQSFSFSAIAAYISPHDKGQRLLVYGGVARGGRSIGCEVYEFCLLTANWRRVEGKRCVPAGHMGHAMAVIQSANKLVVVGGVGPGALEAIATTAGDLCNDPLRAMRAQCFLPPQACLSRFSSLRGSRREGGATAMSRVVTVGFVPYLFEMDLVRHSWQAIQPAGDFLLAFHSAVVFGTEVFVFGGLTEKLAVSGQLLAIDIVSYAIRLVKVQAQQPQSRARDEGASDLEKKKHVDEEAGPGPRYLHSAVCYGNYMVMFGGYDAHNECLDDTWMFDLVNERWERLRTQGGPFFRAGHTACVVGSRMLVLGGFAASSLEEAADPVEQVLELNLIPTDKGEYFWRVNHNIKPALPPLAFAVSAPCGDDHSFVVYGGLTKAPQRLKAETSFSHRGHIVDPRHRSHDVLSGGGLAARTPRHHANPGRPDTDADTQYNTANSFFNRYLTLDDCLVLTFPLKPVKHAVARGADESQVNELGAEENAIELPEHFRIFIHRQDNFLKKKNATREDNIRKITLSEKEDMEPALYFTDDEIAQLIAQGELCCNTFSSFKADTLPSNVPDREMRKHILEECVSLSRQVRDVIKSMKGSAPGITAVKSVAHRKRSGQKFEDYSAAKPYRRVVIAHLLSGINQHLARMHKLNKALRTVDWPEKEEFLHTIAGMQGAVHSLSRVVNRIVNGYITKRVESLAKDAERHKEAMRLLGEAVARNRQDRIWNRAQTPDPRQGRGKCLLVPGAKPAPRAQSRRASSRPALAGSGGYHFNAKTHIVMADVERAALRQRVDRLAQSALTLEEYCRQGSVQASPQGPDLLARIQLRPPAVLDAPAPPAAEQALAPPRPADSRSTSFSSSTSSHPPPLPRTTTALAAGFAALDTETHALSLPDKAAGCAAADEGAAVGSPSEKAVEIQRSNELRRQVEGLARGVRVAARELSNALAGSVIATPPPPSPRVLAPAIPGSSGHSYGGGASTHDTGAPPILPALPMVVSHTPAGLEPPSSPAPLTPSGDGHGLYLKALVPLFDAKAHLQAIAPQIYLIRQNEWAGDDLTGAPKDARVGAMYKRVLRQLTALLQGFTARLLSAAGAKQPPAKPVAPAAPSMHSGRLLSSPNVRRTLAKSSVPVAPASDATKTKVLPVPQLADPGINARSASIDSGSATQWRSKRRIVREFSEMPSSSEFQGEEEALPPRPDPLRSLEEGPPGRETDLSTSLPAQISAPLSSASVAVSPTAPSPPSGATATVTLSNCPQEHVLVWNQPTQDEATGNFSEAGFGRADHDLTEAVVLMASGPMVYNSASEPTADVSDRLPRKDAAAGVESQSALLRHGCLANARQELLNQPAISIAPGPFVINPLNYCESTAAAPAPSQPFHWTVADDDYFYFGCPEQQRGRVVAPSDVVSMCPVAPPTKDAAAVQRPTSASPPVGTALYSQRVNAHLVVSSPVKATSRRARVSTSASLQRTSPLAHPPP